MTLKARTVLMVTAVVAIAVLATAAALAYSTRNAILDQTREDGLLIAELLARSAGFANHVPQDVEGAIGQQMVVEATIAAHLVAIAEQAGLTPDQINDHLRQITDNTLLDEFWITDSKGHAYLRTRANVDFTFSPDPHRQPQASAFWPLLAGTAVTVVQETREREIGEVYKYVGVAGIDKPRIVQVGYQDTFLGQLRQQMGMTRLVEELVAGGQVIALQVVDDGLVTLAYSAMPGLPADQSFDSSDEAAALQVIAGNRAESFLDDNGQSLKVISPVLGGDGRVIGATLVALPTDHVREAMQQQLAAAAVVAAFVLAIGGGVSAVLARRVTEPVERLTAAAAGIESGKYDLAALAAVTRRTDELGRMARVFEHMAKEVYNREQRLTQQVAELRIEIDDARRARQVAEITDTQFFQSLQAKARKLKDQAAS